MKNDEQNEQNERNDTKNTHKLNLKLPTPQSSPFGIACSVTLRSIYRYLSQLESVLQSLPLNAFKTINTPQEIENTQQYNHFSQNPNSNTIHLSSSNHNMSSIWSSKQLISTPDLIFELVRSTLISFTAASPPPSTASVAAQRYALVQTLCQIWQIPITEFDTKMTLHNPILTPDTSLTEYQNANWVSINALGLSRDPKLSQNLLLQQHRFSITRHSRLNIEVIFRSIHAAVPILLVGETGNGKTTLVQYLAAQLGRTFHVHNFNQQSESTDLLGGYKPIELQAIAAPIVDDFGTLLPFNEKNAKIHTQVKTLFASKKWPALIRLLTKIVDSALDPNAKTPSQLLQRWTVFSTNLSLFSRKVNSPSATSFSFWFSEGTLIQALKKGHWILLDEMNLAPNEMLDRLSSLLEDPRGSIALTERGDVEFVPRHPDFRLFACMNPSTDAGKKDLPLGVRTKFLELYIHDILSQSDLTDIVRDTLGPEMIQAFSQCDIVPKIVDFFLEMKYLSKKVLFDGAQIHPHYSTRSLTRALRFAVEFRQQYHPIRALYEGFALSFLSQQSLESRLLSDSLLWSHIFQYFRVKDPVQAPRLYQLNQNGSFMVTQYGNYGQKDNKYDQCTINSSVLGKKALQSGQNGQNDPNLVDVNGIPNPQAQTKHRELLFQLMNSITSQVLAKSAKSDKLIVFGPHLIQTGPEPVQNTDALTGLKDEINQNDKNNEKTKN
jgi:midasin